MRQPTAERGAIGEWNAKRFRVQFPIAFSLEDQAVQSHGIVYNLSIGGCKVTSVRPIFPGLYLKLRLYLPAHETPLEVPLAAVRWSMERDFGVAFLYLQPEEHKRLQQFLTNLETGAPESSDLHAR
jgi:hypothetical protein